MIPGCSYSRGSRVDKTGGGLVSYQLIKLARSDLASVKSGGLGTMFLKFWACRYSMIQDRLNYFALPLKNGQREMVPAAQILLFNLVRGGLSAP